MLMNLAGSYFSAICTFERERPSYLLNEEINEEAKKRGEKNQTLIKAENNIF
jgi:hypothetical protein